MNSIIAILVLLFALLPYLFLFGLLMLPRFIPAVRRLRFIYHLIIATIISIAVNLTATELRDENVFSYSYALFEMPLSILFMIWPYIFVITTSAIAVNLGPLFSGGNIRFKTRRTLIALLTSAAVIFGGIALCRATFIIDVDEQFAPYVTREQLADARQYFINDSSRSLTFPLYAEVVNASERGYRIEAVYFILGRVGVRTTYAP